MEYLSTEYKDIPSQYENSKAVLWKKTSPFVVEVKPMETETTTESEFLNGGKATEGQIQGSEEINKSKRVALWRSQLGIWVGTLTIWVRSFQSEKSSQSSLGLSVASE